VAGSLHELTNSLLLEVDEFDRVFSLVGLFAERLPPAEVLDGAASR
jgi:hypothetical protein